MLEVKVTVTAPELASAINNLAIAINAKISQVQSDSDPQPSVSMSQSQPSNSEPASTPVPVAPAPLPTAPVQAVPTQFQAPTALVQPATPIAGVPLANAPQFTVDQIMAAGATLMDAGKVNDLMNLLHSFGVQAVMELKPEQLGAFATEMRKLGAAI